MHLAVLATATDQACLTEADEGRRFRDIQQHLSALGVHLQSAWNLLGKYDYLLILGIGPEQGTRARTRLVSPQVAAATAVTGRLTSPADL